MGYFYQCLPHNTKTPPDAPITTSDLCSPHTTLDMVFLCGLRNNNIHNNYYLRFQSGATTLCNTGRRPAHQNGPTVRGNTPWSHSNTTQDHTSWPQRGKATWDSRRRRVFQGISILRLCASLATEVPTVPCPGGTSGEWTDRPLQSCKYLSTTTCR